MVLVPYDVVTTYAFETLGQHLPIHGATAR